MHYLFFRTAGNKFRRRTMDGERGRENGRERAYHGRIVQLSSRIIRFVARLFFGLGYNSDLSGKVMLLYSYMFNVIEWLSFLFPESTTITISKHYWILMANTFIFLKPNNLIPISWKEENVTFGGGASYLYYSSLKILMNVALKFNAIWDKVISSFWWRRQLFLLLQRHSFQSQPMVLWSTKVKHKLLWRCKNLIKYKIFISSISND